MKKTLLEIVKSILSDMDSEDVSSLSDTIEAQQVASIVEDTFYNVIASRMIPEHQELIKLTPASDSAHPTHFHYPTNVKEITKVWYEDEDGAYRKVDWCDPMTFLERTDSTSDNYDTVLDQNGGTKLRISNDETPTYYTSFDDYWIVFNSYDSDEDTTLQASKVRAYGTKYPVFEQSDSYIPDLDATMFPYLIAEAKSTAMSLLKGGSDPKIEQAARRQKSYVQNDMFRTKRNPSRRNYGRK